MTVVPEDPHGIRPTGAHARIPVTLVTGFLGSGKTTLINAVLREPAFAGTLVIVNEFGEVGLDNALIANAEDGVVLLDSGCLCCAASGTLRDTLIDLFARPGSGVLPEIRQIIVETSGLANPGPLVATLIGDSALRPRCVLAQVVTLVDPLNAASTLATYAEARHQVAFADTLVLTKMDQADDDVLAGLVPALARLNDTAPLLRWDAGRPATPVFGAADGAPTPAHNTEMWIERMMHSGRGDSPLFTATPPTPAHGAAFAGITACTLRFGPEPMAFSAYATLTGALCRRYGRKLLRCKGLLPLGPAGEPHLVQGVQGYFAPPEKTPASLPAGAFLVCILDGITADELEALVNALPGMPEHTLLRSSKDKTR